MDRSLTINMLNAIQAESLDNTMPLFELQVDHGVHGLFILAQRTCCPSVLRFRPRDRHIVDRDKPANMQVDWQDQCHACPIRAEGADLLCASSSTCRPDQGRRVPLTLLGAGDSFQGWRHCCGRRQSAGQHGELRRSDGTRDYSPIQAGVP